MANFTLTKPIGLPIYGVNTPILNQNLVNTSIDRTQVQNRAVNYLADWGGCGHWRLVWPSSLINVYQHGMVDNHMCMVLDPNYYRDVKTIRIQRQVAPAHLEFVRFLRQVADKNNIKLVYEIDDIHLREDIPLYNGSRDSFVSNEIRQSTEVIMKLCDEISTVSEYMSNYFKEKLNHPKVTTIPNYIPKFWMDRFYSPEKIKNNYINFLNTKKPRVGIFSSSTHFDYMLKNGGIDDYSHITKHIIDTRHDIQWVIVGGKRRDWDPYINNGEIEYHKWTALQDYPFTIDKLNLNLTVAAISNNHFCRAKSDLKIYESGSYGLPFIGQGLEPYKDSPLKFNTGDELIDQIVSLMMNESKYFEYSKQYRALAEGRWLENNLDQHLSLYQFKK